MTDAYRCDRCGAFGEGEPAEYRVCEHTDDLTNPTLAESDLCEDCAEAFEATVEAFFNDDPTDLAHDIERWWDEKARELGRPGQPRGDRDD